MITDIEIDLLKKIENFKYFTILFKKKIYGGMYSENPPSDFNLGLSSLISIKYSFECPSCDRFLCIDDFKKDYLCDCGDEVNLNNIEIEYRYVLDDDFYNWVLDYFREKFEFDSNTFRVIIGEIKRHEFEHNNTFKIHITPQNLWGERFREIDNYYLDHFAIGWNNLTLLFDSKSRTNIFKYILSYREYIITKRLYSGENREKFFKSNVINILHLSDFHFEGGAKDNEKGFLIENIIRDLKKNLLNGEYVHIVIISGDLTQSAQKEQFESVDNLLIQKLSNPQSGVGLGAQNILVVPGNHDINRVFFDNDQFQLLTNKFNEGILHNFWYNDDSNSKLISNFKKFEEFQNFQVKYIKSEPISPTKIYVIKIYERNEKKIGFLGLNSVWVGGNSKDKGRLLLSKYQIIDAMQQGFDFSENLLNIAILHHPISSLHEDEKEEIKSLLYNNFNLILFGHLHDASYELIGGYNTETHLVRAGPIYKTNERKRGTYNLIQININRRIGRIIFRKPHKTNTNAFLYDQEASPKEEDFKKQGIFEFEF